MNDHIVPWQNAYRATQILGGSSRFVLVNSGHIQALVNPPSTETRASYRVTDDPADEPETWVANADVKRGSWWPDYTTWLADRSGGMKQARRTLGSAKFPPLEPAPGTYVLQQ